MATIDSAKVPIHQLLFKDELIWDALGIFLSLLCNLVSRTDLPHFFNNRQEMVTFCNGRIMLLLLLLLKPKRVFKNILWFYDIYCIILFANTLICGIWRLS